MRSASGEPALLLLAHERTRRRLLVLAGDLDVGAVLGDEHVLGEAELRLGALDEAGDVQLLLVDAQLESVHVLGDGVQALAHRGLLAAHLLELLVPARALRLRAAEGDARLGHRGVDRRERGGQRVGDPGGGGELGPAHDGPPSGIRCGLLLGLELPLHGADPRLLGAHPLPRGLEPQARLDLGLTRTLERGERAVAGRGVEHRPGDRPGLLERELRLVGGALGVGDAFLGVRGGLLEACRLGLGGLGLHAGPVQLLGASRELRVELAQGRERLLGLLLRPLEDGALLGEVEPGALELGTQLLEPGAGAVALGDELDAALLADRCRRGARSGRPRCRPS